MVKSGIIAEYNPFHNGHKYHIEKTRELTKADAIICVISGSFVQRGEPAICNKWARAKMALLNGADLCVELPVQYACASAEYFARGGVEILEALGCGHISFGVESEAKEILKTAKALKSPTEEFKRLLNKNLKAGKSYPRALSTALGGDVLNTPNNLLATQYLMYMKNAQPVFVARKGSLHDEKGSASDIRDRILKGEEFAHLMPQSCTDILNSVKIPGFDAFERAVLYKLRTMDETELEKTADVTEGLENRILKMAHRYASYKEITEAIKTKRYTMARIRRILTNALLGIKKTDIGKSPEYIRVLGMNKRGMEVLAECRENTELPIITKVADAPLTDMLKKDITATNIYSTLCNEESMQDYKTHPVII